MSDTNIGDPTREFIEDESWLRQPGETNPAYNAFCMYRDYGGDRSISKVLKTNGFPENRSSLWRAWSSRYQWNKRAGDYDNHLDKIRREEREKDLREREKKHLEISRKMLDIVEKRLDKFDPDELSQNVITDWVKNGIGIDRETLGQEGEKKGNQKQLEISFFEEFDGV